MTAGATRHELRPGPQAAFALERFEWADDGRIEVHGTWSGLRGTRFVRPTLEIEGSGRRRRLLALLDHKPWTADAGEPWTAAFMCDGEPIEVESAHLHVAPGVVVELPPPSRPGRAPASARTRVPAEAAPMKRRPGKPAPAPPDEGDEPAESADAEAVDVDALRAELAAAQERVAEAERWVAILERERDDAVTKRRAAATELEALRQAHERQLIDARAQEREHAAAALAEGAQLRERVERERDDAVAQREIAYRERDEALVAKEQALEERKQALAERKDALRDRDKALRDRDKALRDRDKALGEAERALAARDEAHVDRDRAKAERDLAVNERDALVRAHERGLPLRPPKPRYLRDNGERRSELDVWMQRAVALLVLGVFILVILRLFIIG